VVVDCAGGIRRGYAVVLRPKIWEQYLPDALKWSGHGIAVIFLWLIHPILVPRILVGVAVLILLGFLAVLGMWYANQRRAKKGPPPLEFWEYTEDDIDQFRWRWDFVNGQIDTLLPYCRTCERRIPMDMRSDYPPCIAHQCPCGRDYYVVKGRPVYLGEIAREIDMRLRTGKWKPVVQELRKRQMPLSSET
jgi:hypothetical protein